LLCKLGFSFKRDVIGKYPVIIDFRLSSLSQVFSGTINPSASLTTSFTLLSATFKEFI